MWYVDKEYSSNVEAHELLDMIKDGLDSLPLGDELDIRVKILANLNALDNVFIIKW